MTKFTFIHAADLHLDCPFSGVGRVSPEAAELLYRATFDAFENLVGLCIEKHASFLLLAGDLFEHEGKSLRALFRFRAGVEKLDRHGIATLCVHGNHDPPSGASGALLDAPGLFTFPTDRVAERIIEKDGAPLARVRGMSYASREEGRNLVSLFPPNDGRLFTVGLVHANAGGVADHANYAPCLASELDGRCDYWALGHVHQRRVISEEPYAVYPGNTQARSIREPGPRGCYVAEVEAGRVRSLAFAPLDAVRWENLEVDILGCRNAEEATEAAAELVAEARHEAGDRPLCCRVTLAGRTAAYRELAKPGMGPEIRDALADRTADRKPLVWVEEVAVSTAPLLDMDALAADTGLVGALFSIAAEIAASPGDGPPPFVEDALADLFSDKKMPKELAELSRDEALSLLTKARNLCAELLSEDAP
ncbi:MAG: DNA repair exonuclease [Thermodesulfobacteriota bacterium]